MRWPARHCSLGSLFLLHLLPPLFLLSSRTVALLCLSSTLHSFVLLRAPLEGLIAAHTRSPFVSSFCHLFSGSPFTQQQSFISLTLDATSPVSTSCLPLCGHENQSELSHISFLHHPCLPLASVPSNTVGNLSFRLLLAGKRSVFIIFPSRSSTPSHRSRSTLTFRLGAILLLFSTGSFSLRGKARERERERERGKKNAGRRTREDEETRFNASVTFVDACSSSPRCSSNCRGCACTTFLSDCLTKANSFDRCIIVDKIRRSISRPCWRLCVETIERETIR